MGKRLLNLLTNFAIDVLALVIVDLLFAGITLDTWQAVVGGAILLALVNAYLRPFILLLTLPFNILSLGLFTFVINATMLKVVSWLLPGFHVTGFWTAVGAALVISFVSFILHRLLKPTNNFRVTVIRD
ncbi:MAG: phage holin family protein [Verrucomicrobiota bacterium]